MASNLNIQTDAQCENPRDKIRHGEKDRVPGVSRPLYSYNDMLKQEADNYYFDFLIICSKTDEDDARELQKFLEDKFNCSSKLLSNTVLPTDTLEENLERTMFTLLYVTKSLIDCEWTRSIGPICQKRTLEEKKKQWTVIPVYTEQNSQNAVPLTLRHLVGIEYWREDRDETGFSNIIGSQKVELSQRRQSTSKKTEQLNEKIRDHVIEDKKNSFGWASEEAKHADVKMIKDRVHNITLSSMLHVDRPSSISVVEADNSDDKDVTVDGKSGTLTTDSGVFVDSGGGGSSHVKIGSNTTVNEEKRSDGTKGLYKPKYDIPGPEDSDSN